MPKKVDQSKYKPKMRMTGVFSAGMYEGPVTNVTTWAVIPADLPTAVNSPAEAGALKPTGGRWNVYDNPEKFGLEQVAQIDYSDGSYQFDYRVVWKSTKKDGTLYTARNAGCSCPSPFEEYTSLKELDRFSLSEVEEEVLEERTADHYRGDNPAPFLEAVRALVPKTYPQGPRRLLSLEG